MSITILDNGINEAVRVTSADWNGSSFDGNPFSNGPKWLVEALQAERIIIFEDDRDYACWKVFTPHGEVIAEPGDIIMHQAGIGLTVYTKKSGK